MSLLFALLAFLTPVVLPGVALAVGVPLGFWLRLVGVLLASLLSLPLGFVLALLAHDPAIFTYDHINPGLGVVATPVMMEWAVVFAVTVIASLYLAVRRVFFRSNK